jgi:ferredoxin--NADP+ reductase
LLPSLFRGDEKLNRQAGAATMPDDPYNAYLSQIDVFNEYTWIFHIKSDTGDVPEFEPGQFTTIGLIDPEAEPKIGKDGKPKVKLIRRAYSIASASDVRDHFELLIILVDDGKLTPPLFKMKVDDRLWLSSKISGDFTLEPVPDDRNLVLIGTGTGVAPYVSMIRRYHGHNRWNKCVVIQGVRFEKDLAYREEFEKLAAEEPNFAYIPCVTRDDNWKGLKGRVPAALDPELFEKQAGFLLRSEDCSAFLCGSPQMIDDVEAMLLECGFKTHKKKDPGNIHLERYW